MPVSFQGNPLIFSIYLKKYLSMKKTIFSFVILSALSFGACNNAADNNHEGHEAAVNTPADTAVHATTTDESEVKIIAATFKDVDGKIAASIKSVVDAYLQVKNALVEDNAADAARFAAGITSALKGLDKSLLTADQKTVFDAAEANLKSGAAELEKQPADIAAQRTHFYTLSQGVYELAKAFGSGRPLFHDHCPMARDNQGALWISEIREVKNPYFGADMLTCGTVEEVIN
jgi:Protein of unknown function (DUF3347)